MLTFQCYVFYTLEPTKSVSSTHFHGPCNGMGPTFILSLLLIILLILALSKSLSCPVLTLATTCVVVPVLLMLITFTFQNCLHTDCHIYFLIILVYNTIFI